MTYIHAPVYVNIPSDNGVGVHFDGIIPVVAVPSGPQGLPGQDGFSPVVTVTAITGGHQVSIEDATGTETFDVMDGEKGETGATGATGPAGADGVGVPSGGTTGQVLKKRSAVNYDTEWSDENDAVDSVNGQTGAVVLNASDVGALPDTYTAPVSSVNSQTGEVVLNASDVGALASTTTAADIGGMSKWVKLWENASPTSAFAAQTLTIPWENYDFLVIQAYYNYDQYGNAFVRSMFIDTNRISENWQYPHSYEILAEQGNGGGAKATRKLTFGTGTITIAHGSVNGGSSAVNSAAVPCDIYGIKGVTT